MRRAVLLAVLGWHGVSAAQPAPGTIRLGFQWTDAVVAGRTLARAAMLVPIDAARPTGRVVQFDTGADDSIVYAWALDTLVADGHAKRLAGGRVKLRLHSAPSDVVVDARVIEHGGPGGPVGTLGANLTANSLWIVDPVRKDVVVVRGADQARAAACVFDTTSDHVPLHVVGTRSGIDVDIGGRRIGPVLYDTGTSAFGVVLFSRFLWNEVPASDTPADMDSLRVSETFSGPVTLDFKRVRGSTCIGRTCLPEAEVGVSGVQAVPGFVGTLGNRHLGSGFVAVDAVGGRALFSREPLVGPIQACLREVLRDR